MNGDGDTSIEMDSPGKGGSIGAMDRNDIRNLELPLELLFDSHRVIIDTLDYKQSSSLQIKIIVSFLCLLNVGMAEQTTGVLMRYLLDYYNVDHSIISFIFLVQFVGFLSAALLNDYMHKVLGLRGTILSCQLACLVCFGICSMRPPLPVFIFFYLLNGYSTGCQNSTFNTWGGKLEYHNQIMGLLHSAYGIGSIISPILATHLLERNNGNWRQWYFILTANALILSILSFFAFKDETKWKYLYLLTNGSANDNTKSSMMFVIRDRLIWVISGALFFYVGGEVTLGNWIYNYLIEIKDLAPRPSSFITSAYWLGMTVGRLALGFYIGAYHEDDEAKVLLYISIAICSSMLLFALIPVLIVQVVCVMIVGFLIGPVFPTVAIVALKKLPLVLHVSGISFISSIGGSGGGILPFVVGLVSSLAKPGDDSGEGLVWFPLIDVTIFLLSLGFWCLFYFKIQNQYQEVEGYDDEDIVL